MERHEIEAEAKKMVEKLKAVFLLADIEIKSFHQLPNGYCGDQCCSHRPWGLAETKYGLIKIGWRKRVISIEWPTEAEVNGKNVKSKDEEWITHWEAGVHAYGWAKAVEYLSEFAKLANRVIYDREADTRLTAPELEEYRSLKQERNETVAKAREVDKYAYVPLSPRLEELDNKRNARAG